MVNPAWQEVAQSIHQSGRRLVAAVTGGGSGALGALLQTPGASRSVLEAVVPYSQSALVKWIGASPDQWCSESTARAMAMAAFVRARRLAAEADPFSLVGAACTASLATDRPKRGNHRVHVAVQTAGSTLVRTLSLPKEGADRAAEEAAAARLLLAAIAEACGVEASALFDATIAQRTTGETEQAPAARVELLLQRRPLAVVKPWSTTEHFDEGAAPAMAVVFPGAFNPPHVGHRAMAAIAERRLGRPIAWELSIANVDKPPLDYLTLRRRVEALRDGDRSRPIALTHAATFREKAALFPGATFVVGADTAVRIAEPRYYGDDVARRDEAIAEIASRGCRFLVFGREMEGRFGELDDLQLPDSLRRVCEGVPAAEFREDLSSTELRLPP